MSNNQENNFKLKMKPRFFNRSDIPENTLKVEQRFIITRKDLPSPRICRSTIVLKFHVTKHIESVVPSFHLTLSGTSSLGTGHKVRGGGAAEIGGGLSIFKLK